MRKILCLALLFLAAAAGGAVAPGAAACVTCENMQCVAIATSGALDCSSGWFLGSYCNLTGHCTVKGTTAIKLDKLGIRAWLRDLPAAEPPAAVAHVSPWSAVLEMAAASGRAPAGV